MKNFNFTPKEKESEVRKLNLADFLNVHKMPLTDD